jgi:hypothetical protein
MLRPPGGGRGDHTRGAERYFLLFFFVVFFFAAGFFVAFFFAAIVLPPRNVHSVSMDSFRMDKLCGG